MLNYVVPILILSVLMLAHELGHFFAAKSAGIRVEEFGFGFPPRLLRLAKRGDTEYTLNVIPFGAFVKMAGENEAGVDRGFTEKSKRARLVVLAAGSIMNLLMAVLFFALAYISGAPTAVESKHAVVLNVEQGSPAEIAGLKYGDVIVKADGIEILTAAQLSEYVSGHAGQQVTLNVRRNGEFFDIPAVPRQPAPNQGALGISISEETTKVTLEYSSPQEALSLGVREVWDTIRFTVSVPAMLINQVMSPEMARPVGPVGIFQITGSAATQTAETGWWYPILRLIGVLGVALGFTNLLPLPALDGGRILFILVEAIRGKRVDPQKEGLVHWVGLMMLVAFMVFITYQDIVSPVPNLQIPNPF